MLSPELRKKTLLNFFSFETCAGRNSKSGVESLMIRPGRPSARSSQLVTAAAKKSARPAPAVSLFQQKWPGPELAVIHPALYAARDLAPALRAIVDLSMLPCPGAAC
jgi:hypothetical protein